MPQNKYNEVDKILNLSRIDGKNTKMLLEFFYNGKQGKAVIIRTPEGDFLSPKAVHNLLSSYEQKIDKLLEGMMIPDDDNDGDVAFVRKRSQNLTIQQARKEIKLLFERE